MQTVLPACNQKVIFHFLQKYFIVDKLSDWKRKLAAIEIRDI